MNTTYFYQKQEYTKNDTVYMYIVFENSDYVTIKNPEIININIKTYDRLVRDNNGVCPVAYSGYIKLKIIHNDKFDI